MHAAEASTALGGTVNRMFPAGREARGPGQGAARECAALRERVVLFEGSYGLWS